MFTPTDHGRGAVIWVDAGEGPTIYQTLLDGDEHTTCQQVQDIDREVDFAFTGDVCVEWRGQYVGHLPFAMHSLAGSRSLDAAAGAGPVRHGGFATIPDSVNHDAEKPGIPLPPPVFDDRAGDLRPVDGDAQSPPSLVFV